MLTNLNCRSKTKLALNCLANRAAHQTNNLRSKNPFSNSHHSFPPSIAIRNTSVHAKIAILAQSGVQSDGYSISVLLRASWWLQWRVCRYLLWGSFSRVLGRDMCEWLRKLAWCDEGRWEFKHKGSKEPHGLWERQGFHEDYLMLLPEGCWILQVAIRKAWRRLRELPQ